MAEAVFRIPSRTVQYGYVEVEVPFEQSTINPEMLAAQYVSYVYAFQKEEEATVSRLKEGVSAPVAAPEPDPRDSVGDPVAAAVAAIQEGLGDTTELSDDGENSDEAPWSKTVDAKPKPWETGSAAPAKVVDLGDDW